MNVQLHLCTCPHCSNGIEYADDYSGQVIDCPSCHQALTLPVEPFQPIKPGLVSGLFEKFTEAVQARADRMQLKQLLLESVSDGVLTGDEIEQVRSFMEATGIDESHVHEWSRDIFAKAVESLTPLSVSAERIEQVRHIREYLRLPEAYVRNEMDRIARFQLIVDIRNGKLPTFSVQNVLLRGGEQVHWEQPGTLYEERVVSRRYEGGSAGFSFRVAKGVTFRTGGTRGRLVTDTADVPVSVGSLIITNRRFIFRGDGKSFDTKFEKIIDLTNHVDGITFSESGKQKLRKISYAAPNGDIIVEILSYIFSPKTGI